MSRIFGRKPGQHDIGYGESLSGVARASIMGRLTSNGWIYELGGRMGRNTGITPSVTIGVYQAYNTSVTAQLGLSGTINPSALMVDSWSGADYTSKPSSPIMVSSGVDYALDYLSTGASVAVGQDNSGHPMYQRSGLSSQPSPFGGSSTPQGKISIWAVIQDNRPPSTPSTLSPTPNSLVVSTPVLGADFRDPDEDLPGFSIGEADKVKSYRFEIWNSAKTSRLQDTGKATASGLMQSQRRVAWTPSTLAANRYIARCTVWDQFDTPSTTAEWAFTVNAGGVFTNVGLSSSNYDGPDITNHIGTAADPLLLEGIWTHSSGLNTSTVEYQMRNKSGTIVRGPSTLNYANPISNGAKQTFYFHDIVGWSGLIRGQEYTLEMRARDSSGLWSAWASSSPFTVNAAPETPELINTVGKAYSSPPPLYANAADPSDDDALLTYRFRVRANGASGDGVEVPASRITYNPSEAVMIGDFGSQAAALAVTLTVVLGDIFGGGEFGIARAGTSSAEVPSYGTYQWASMATDPWGLSSAWSSWETFTYAPAPTMTAASPSNNSVKTTGTPHFLIYASKALVSYRLILRTGSGVIAYDSGEVATSGTSFSHDIPAGKLHNATTYNWTVTLTSTDGLIGTDGWSFTVQYPQPSAMSSMLVEAFPGPFEPDAAPSQWSRVKITWNQATTGQVSNNDFSGYLVRRTNMATGDSLILGRLLSRSSTVFIDKTAVSGVAYQYDAIYLSLKNNLDMVESLPASGQMSLVLKNTVLASLDDDDIGFPLRFWESRSVEYVHDHEIIPTFSDTPIVFTGPADSRVITGSFVLIDDPYFTFTAMEIASKVSRASSPSIDEDGRIQSRIFFYRDPRGRSMSCIITTHVEDDPWVFTQARLSLTLTEVFANLGVEVDQ